MSTLGFYTYDHTRNDTGAVFYVGKGRGIRAKKTCGRNPYWRNIVAKAGGFSVRMIAEGVDEELAFLVEESRIDQLRRLGVHLCNMTDGGEGKAGCVASPATRQRISARVKGENHPLFGVPRSEETKQKLRVANIGKKASDGARQKMSLAHRGNTYMLGKKASDGTKAKLSAIHAGKPKSDAHKRKISAAHIGKSMPVVVCPHCLKEGDVGNMARWHFKNCKQKEL